MTAVAGHRPSAPPAPGAAAGWSRAWSDVVFVGAGASTAYTLLALLDGLRGATVAEPLRIDVVERAPDAFSGLPYGSRTAPASLLITSLRDFLPDGERAAFTAWLSANKRWAFDEFRAAAGPDSERWWARHEADIHRDEFDELFLPRYLFGLFLRERTLGAVADAEAAGTATTTVHTDEVLVVDATPGGYLVTCRGRQLQARRVVLAVGSPPPLPRVSEGTAGAAVVLDDPFSHMPTSLERIRAALAARSGQRPPHVLLIGGNASTMDLLYLVDDLGGSSTPAPVFTVLTPQGSLPTPIGEAPGGSCFVPERLAQLAEVEEVSARAIYDAAVADIRRGEAAGLPAGTTVRPVSQAVGRLLPRLAPDQAAEFAGRWGNRLGRHQRRAGHDYLEIVGSLAREGRLRLLTGSFLELRTGSDGTARARYEADGLVTDDVLPVDVVVNCAGPGGDLRRSAPPLVEHLVSNEVCRLTPFGTGVAVGPSFEGAPELHVMGPLLAGNVLRTGPVWHMEHCGRISAFGGVLGKQLAGALAG